MGGKSRKAGGVSKALINRIKQGSIGKKGKGSDRRKGLLDRIEQRAAEQDIDANPDKPDEMDVEE